MNKSERKHLMQLVQDCDTYRLSEKEALEYIKTRFEKPISARQYYRIKHTIQSEGAIKSWLDNFTNVGFVLEHKRRIDEIELIQKISMNLLKDETDEPKSERNNDLILKLMGEIRKNIVFFVHTELGAPIVDEVHKKIDSNKQKTFDPKLSERKF